MDKKASGQPLKKGAETGVHADFNLNTQNAHFGELNYQKQVFLINIFDISKNTGHILAS